MASDDKRGTRRQKVLQLSRRLAAKTGNRRNLFERRRFQPLHRAESFRQCRLANLGGGALKIITPETYLLYAAFLTGYENR
jgi:hypothetical protein